MDERLEAGSDGGGGFRPLSARDIKDTTFDVLHEGVPRWMHRRLMSWLRARLDALSRDIGGTHVTVWRAEEVMVQELEVALHCRFSGPSIDQMLMDATQSSELALDLLDLLLFHGDLDAVHREVAEDMLSRSGSAWRVFTDEENSGRLVRRVSDSTLSAVTQVVDQHDAASTHMSDAFGHAYGRQPKASHAYLDAVKAVESAGRSIVLPDDSTATLGKMIQAVRAKPSKWRCALHPDSPDEAMNDVLGMMRLLWKGQHDRHGEGSPEPDTLHKPEMTLEEARAAVDLAVTLTTWFQQGSITRTGR